jgi:ornithine--oxo-acid transaminase
MPPAPRHFYLLPPTRFRVEYAINQWMDPKRPVDQGKAMQQWQSLKQVYEDLGADVDVIELDDPQPDHVFIGDSVFLYGDKAVASRFRYAERTEEVEPILEQIAGHGFEILRLPEGMYYEGNGDTIHWNGRLLAGYDQRSSLEAHAQLESLLEVPVISLDVQAPHFHVDTCITPLDANTLAYVAGSLSAESMESVRGLGADLIEISVEEGLRLAGNCITINGHVVLSTTEAPAFSAALESAGFTPVPLDLSEFAKSGGGAKCLTLEAYPAN